MRTIYLDYNTTTPPAGAARQAMLPYLEDFFAAPGNPHWQSRAVEETIEDARSSLATLLGCNTSEVVFTSGGTESNNLALFGAARAFEETKTRRSKGHLIISNLEHLPVSSVADRLASQGWEVTRLACDQGVVDPDRLQAAIRKNTALISIQLAGAQTGVLQDIAKLSRVSRPAHCLFHTDGTQAFGKIEVEVDDLGIDLLSISAHKMYGPKGIGALFVRDGVAIKPQMVGGWEEGGLRPGMACPMLLAGFSAAAQLVKAGGAESAERLRELRNRFVDRFEEASNGGYSILGTELRAEQLPNTVAIRLKNCNAAKLLANTPELHIGLPISHDLTAERSFEGSPLEAVGQTLDSAREMVVVSVGWNTTVDEVETGAEKLAEAHRNYA